jgi:hypothetical protein
MLLVVALQNVALLKGSVKRFLNGQAVYRADGERRDSLYCDCPADAAGLVTFGFGLLLSVSGG